MNKRQYLLLYFAAFLFFSLLIILCYNSRLATDDYYFIWDVRENGIAESLRSQYMEWSGRYTATIFMDLIYLLGTDQTWYFLFPLFSFIFLFFGLINFLKGIFKLKGLSCSKKDLYLLAFSLMALLFFMSADIGETWFWYVSLTSYQWSLIAFLWGVGFLLLDQKIFSVVLSSLCFIYIGGASELYSVMYGIFFLYFYFHFYKKRESVYLKTVNRNSLIVFFFFGVAFLVMLIAPGNYLRDGLFPEHRFFFSFFVTAKSFVKYGLLYFPTHCIYLLAFAPVFCLIGSGSRETQISFSVFFKKATLLFLLFNFLYFYMVAFVMSETGPPRIWFMADVLLVTYVCSIAFYAGRTHIVDAGKLKALFNASLILGFLVLGVSLWKEIPSSFEYARKHDKRTKDIQDLNKVNISGTTVNLPPLPPSGMLYSAEISADTNHFTNKELRMGYGLNYYPVCDK